MKYYGCICRIRYFGAPYKKVEILYSDANKLKEKYDRLVGDYPEESGYDVDIIKINTYKTEESD